MTNGVPDLEPAPRRPQGALGYGLALLLSAVALGIAVLLDRQISVANLSLIFVLPVVIVAANFSLGAALTAAVVGAAGANFFLIAPRYSFSVADSADLWGLFLLLVVAVIVSAVAGEARRRTLEARAHAAQAVALQGLARSLVAANERSAIVGAAREALCAVFDAPAVVVVADEGGVLAEPTLSEADLQAARWSLSSRHPLRSDAYPAEGAGFDFWPVTTPSRLQAVIGVALARRTEGRPQEADRLVEIVGAYLAVALERERFAAQAARAALAVESERVKADLLAAVSHDLRTPLSTILVALQSLQRFGDNHDAATQAQLLSLAEAETARLSALVGNLLDMGRIEAGAVAVQIAPLAIGVLLAAALERARPALANRVVDNRVGAEAPVVLADAGLAAAALANVLDNADKYAPAGSTVTIAPRIDGAQAVIDITDQGPGLPDQAVLFDKFARGAVGDGRSPGTGLGLSIARGFLTAQGGSIDAADRADAPGARITIRLPLAQAPS